MKIEKFYSIIDVNRGKGQFLINYIQEELSSMLAKSPTEADAILIG
jgi:hypothetical protein